MEAILAIYGSHNSTIGLAVGNEIKEVIEIERLVNKKNASLYFYPTTQIDNPKEVLMLVRDLFEEKYGITEYSCVYYDMVDLNQVKSIFISEDYIATGHHRNHSCSTLYQSEHKEALVLSFDGGGNDGWFRIFRHKRGQEPVNLLNKPLNLGVCYGMVGHYVSELKHEPNYLMGNLVYAGKLMGLAGYGKVREEWIEEFNKWYNTPAGVDHETLFKELLIRLKVTLTDGVANSEDSKDLAATSQYVLEEFIISVLSPFIKKYPKLPLHITGGGGLNILLNTRLSELVETFVSPNPSDCGLAVGMLCGHLKPSKAIDITYAGPTVLDKHNSVQLLEEVDYKFKHDITNDNSKLISDLTKGMIIGVARNGSEHGPRALGNRSIICNPSIDGMKDILNAKVKHREWYRPFAPVVRLEDVSTYFDFEKESRWMNYCPKVKEEYKDKLQAITHIDGTARVQTVTESQNPWLYRLLTDFKEHTGIGVLLNTSFNVDGKPILNTYKDAIEVYSNTELDGLVLQNLYVTKKSRLNKNTSEELTVMSGIWNIEGTAKEKEKNLEYLNSLLSLDCNLFLLLPRDLERLVWDKRNTENTFVQIYELEDIKNMNSSFWDKIQTIRTSKDWKEGSGKRGWLKRSRNLKNQWQIPLLISKFSHLNNLASWNPFKSEFFLWIDPTAAPVFESKNLTDVEFTNLTGKLDDLFCLTYSVGEKTEIGGFSIKELEKITGKKLKQIVSGELLGGSKETIQQYQGVFWHTLNNTLNAGLLGNDESILTIMYEQHPKVFNTPELDSIDSISKFLNKIKTEK